MIFLLRRWLALVLLHCLGAVPTAAAQYRRSILELQTDSLLADLRQQGVDTICLYKSYCVGCRGYWVADSVPCRTKGILILTYFFWQHMGRTYARKLDNCSLGLVRAASQAIFWPYFFAYSSQIKKEEIKEFATASHGGVFAFDFYTKADTVAQYFKGISLEKRVFRHHKGNNPYYRHNSRTHTAHLQQLLDESVAATFPKL